MKKYNKKVISLEELEYEVYKNQNEIIKKRITLDDFFKIEIKSKKYEN